MSSTLIFGRDAESSTALAPDIKDKPIEEVLDVSPLLRLKFITLQLIGKGGVHRKRHARALGANKSLWLATAGRGGAETELGVIPMFPGIEQGCNSSTRLTLDREWTR